MERGRNVGAAGGAYLRILPPALMRRAFRAMNDAGHPAVLYLHPWEVDPEQPRVKGAGLRAVTHRVNLRGTMPRLAALLDRFEFAPMRDVLASAPGLAEPPVEVPA
jgi:hypothetical protein